jgi:hypothetical protein
MAIDSSGFERHVEGLGHRLAVFESVSKNAQRQDFRFFHRLGAAGAVSHYARKLHNLTQPTAVVLALNFNRQVHTLLTYTPSAGLSKAAPAGARLVR